jgi:hypothetical protein
MCDRTAVSTPLWQASRAGANVSYYHLRREPLKVGQSTPPRRPFPNISSTGEFVSNVNIFGN